LSRYPLGQPVTIPITVKQRNTDGTYSLVDATTVTTVIKLAQADGTTTTTGTYTSPAHDGLGAYHQDVPVTDLTGLGHYQYAVTTTGPGAGVQSGDFDVFDPFEPALLPLQDGKSQLNIPATVTTYDTEIQDYIATIESSLEGETGGPLISRTVTERGELDGTCTVLQVQQRPLVSVTSITPVATGLAADLSAGLDLDKGAGIIRAIGGRTLAASWNAAVTVVYVAGWGTVMPAAFNIIARIILQHLWLTQHGPSARPSMGGEETVLLPGWGFAVPRQAAELLNGSLGGIPFRLEVFA
jgi:hypothetical protein